MNEQRLRDALRSARLPDEEEARARAWRLVRDAHSGRERVWWPRRHGRPLAVAVVGAALLASAVTTPGRAVLNSIRDAVGREQTSRPAARALTSLPGGGHLLVASRSGLWLIEHDGSRRRLGPYEEASWSPHGRYYAATTGHEILAAEPSGERAIHWTLSRPGHVTHPRWATDGYRVAYLAGSTLRVVAGDGTSDGAIGAAKARVAPAWRPLHVVEPKGSKHELTYVTPSGVVRNVDTDLRRTMWTARAPDGVRELLWSGDGQRLLVVGRRSVRSYDGRGRFVLSTPMRGRTIAASFRPASHRFAVLLAPPTGSVAGTTAVLVGTAESDPRFRQVFAARGPIADVAWSPQGRWLLVSWSGADQWQFIRPQQPIGRPPSRIVGFSNIARQFDPSAPARASFPTLTGWCCAPSP